MTEYQESKIFQLTGEGWVRKGDVDSMPTMEHSKYGRVAISPSIPDDPPRKFNELLRVTAITRDVPSFA